MHTDVRSVDMGLGLTRAFSVLLGNAADASFTVEVPTITKPTGTGVFDMKAMKEIVARYLDLQFFGQGNDDQTFNIRITGFKPVKGQVPLDPTEYTTLWMPRTLAEFVCTLGTAVGVNGTQVTATDKMVDKLVVTTGNSNVDVEIISPDDNTEAHALIDLKGCHLIKFSVDMVSATNGNALFAIL